MNLPIMHAERPERRFRGLLAWKTPVLAIFPANNTEKRLYRQSGCIIGNIRYPIWYPLQQ